MILKQKMIETQICFAPDVGRLEPNKGYEREISMRKQASEVGRLLWFLVGGITDDSCDAAKLQLDTGL